MFLQLISYRMPVILQKQKLSLMYKLLSNELGYSIAVWKTTSHKLRGCSLHKLLICP